MLTREEINALEPGLPADAAAAEFVMGWNASFTMPGWWTHEYEGSRRMYWRPSTDIAAAMEVVEHIREVVRASEPTPDRQFSISISADDLDGDMDWTVELYGAGCQSDAREPTLPFAITKAALLRALDIKEREQT